MIHQHRQGTIKIKAKKPGRLLDSKTKDFTTTSIQC